MKVIPSAISRKIAEQGLLASEKSPKILFVAGVAGMVGSTVLACRATLQLSDTLDAIEQEKDNHTLAKARVERADYEGDLSYPDQEYKRDLTVVTIHGMGKIAKLYAPAVLLGAASVACLTKSHNLLEERNLALTAAYAAVDSAFKNYRERVVDRYGEDVDRELRYTSEELDIVDEDTGEIISEMQLVGAPGSAYARFFDQDSSRNWSEHPDINMLFLRQVQNYMNDRLKIRGHVFLNEVYNDLGLSHTKAGAVVGWRWQKGSGDDYIDFGIWDGDNERARAFFNGREGAILLDFNVDGVIYDQIEESF